MPSSTSVNERVTDVSDADATARSRTSAGAPVAVAKLGCVGPFNEKSPEAHAAAGAATPTTNVRDRRRAPRRDNLNKKGMCLTPSPECFFATKKAAPLWVLFH